MLTGWIYFFKSYAHIKNIYSSGLLCDCAWNIIRLLEFVDTADVGAVVGR